MASRPYEARVAPGGTARLGQANGAAFGAQFGDAVAGLGDALQRVQRNEDNAKASLALENLKAETEDFERSLRDGSSPMAQPGAVGHSALVSQYWDERANRLADSVGDRQLRDVVDLRMAEYRRSLVNGAETYEAAQRIAKLGQDNRDAVGVIANRARRMDDPMALADALRSYDLQVEGYAGLPPDQADAMRKEGHEAIRLNFLRGQVDRNPAAARALIERGAFDDLDPKLIDGELSAIGVEERRREAEAEAQARLEKADAKEQIDIFLKAGKDGVPQSREEFARIKGLIAQHDLAKDGYDVAKLETERAVLRETRPMLPGQIANALNAVETRIARAGERASPQDIWRRDALRDALGQRRSQIANDPYGYAAVNGNAVAPLDLADPASVQARLRVNRTLGAATGNPNVPLLQPDEANELAAQAAGGPQQRAALAGSLARFGGPAALRAARQVAPNDHVLAQAISLPPQMRVAVFEGEKLRKANGALAPAGEVKVRFQERAAAALAELPADYRNGVMETAANLYAFRAARSGETGFDEDLFDQALNEAIDPTGRGGIGEWNGYRVKLPYGMSQQDFDKRLSRGTVLNGAYHADRTPITASELRSRFHPVASPVAGQYWFADRRGNYAIDKTGQRAALKLGEE